jgi:hypothetical protein
MDGVGCDGNQSTESSNTPYRTLKHSTLDIAASSQVLVYLPSTINRLFSPDAT